MDDTLKTAEKALVHLTDQDLLYPLQCIREAAHVGSPGQIREELEWWFQAALTHGGGAYDDPDSRDFAFRLRTALLKMIEMAHYLKDMTSSEFRDKLIALFR
jgi:hypothetical protein